MRSSCRWVIPGAFVFALLLAAAHDAVAAPLEVERDDSGWTVKATGVRVEDVLDALAAREPFGVAMQLGVERPLVDADVRDASLEQVLRNVLRGRNYTIAYRDDGDRLAVSRVELLLPRPPRGDDVAAGAPGANLTAEDQARFAARAQRMREQQMFARLRNAGVRSAPQRVAAQRVAPAQVVAEPVPLHRQLWNRIWSGVAR
jgi:hypothetical protein